MAKIIQQITECKEPRPECDNRVCPPKVRYWLLNVAHQTGDGWAIVCAPNVPMAQGIFLR